MDAHRSSFWSLVVIAMLAVVPASPVYAASTGCPSSVVFEPDATGSRIDAGWTGLAHDVPVNGYALRMDMSCGSSSPPCGLCTITGLAPNAGGNNQRCVSDTSIICTVPTEVADCGGVGLCRFFAAAPTAISTGGVSTCYTTTITGPATGTANVDTGELSPDIPLHVQLYIGSMVDEPCPRCAGDPSPNDNVRGGTCTGGPRNGLACDGNATAEYPDFGTTSFDCPPPPASKTADFVLGTVTFTTGSQSVALTTANPLCTASFAGERCFCASCNNGAAQACSTNADCPDPPGPIGPICGGRWCLGGSNDGAACTVASECPLGICGRLGEPSRPSSCLDDTSTPGLDCVDDGSSTDQGLCFFGPLDSQCSLASGHPQRGCLSDLECGGMAGSCETSPRKCYLDNGVLGSTVQVAGVATPPVGNASDPTMLGALTCLAPTSTPAVNAVGGFPGLARAVYPGRAIFAEKVVVEVAPPGGTVTTWDSGPASVVETSVTTPTGGEVEIIGSFNAGSPPSGYTFLGRLVQIEAPPASAASPLVISFDIDASEVPPGENETTIALFRNDVGPIPNCLGATQAIPNDPCISARTALGGGDVRLTVLTSAASDWAMAAVDTSFCPPAIDPLCRPPFVGGKSQVQFSDKTPDTKDQLQWKWLKGSHTTLGELGNPAGTDDYALCIYNDVGRTAALLAPAGGTCGTKPCWSFKPTGVQYKDKEATPSGITQITLKAGIDGKAQIQVKGKGANLAMPVIGDPMTVQLRNVATGMCWTATYSSPFTKNDGVTFKDKAD